MKITQQDIANKLGITRTTVARALNSSGPVKPELRSLILSTAKEMGYKVNYQAKTLSMQKEIVIWVFLPSFYNADFVSEVCDGVAKAQKELFDAKLRVNVHINQSRKVADQIDEMKSIIDSENPEGIIIIPLSDESIEPIFKLCRERNIRFVTLDMDAESFHPTFHVGPNYYLGGQLCGGLMKRLAKKRGTILLLKPERFYSTLDLRRNGFKDAISQSDDLTYREIALDIEKEVIYDVVLQELKKQQGIVGIYSTMKVDGIPEAVKELGLQEDVLIIANDISPYVADFVNEDIIDACIYFRPLMQGYKAVKSLFEGIILNKSEFNDIETYFDIVIKENLKVHLESKNE